MVGTTISHYRILQQLGTGGMGVVYRAEDVRLGREVALKFLPTDMGNRDALARFNREARLASSLSHPHICTIHSIDEHEGRPFIVMEYCSGWTVKQLVESWPLAPAMAVDIAIQATEALESAHARGIVHRDIKPANLLVSHDGQVKVLDFGLAKLIEASRRPAAPGSADSTAAGHADEELTRPGMTLGTVSYMSPEQALGQPLDARSDLFSIGSVLYEMLTGQRAFPGSTFALVYDRILNRAPTPPSSVNPNVPPVLDDIVRRLQMKRPEDRYQSAGDLLADLRRVERLLAGPDTTQSQLSNARALVALPTSPVRDHDPDAPTAEDTPRVAPDRDPSIPPITRTRRTWVRGVIGATTAIALLAVVSLIATRHWPASLGTPISERDVILLAGIENRTGEAVFEGTLAQALSVQLAQSPFLNLVPEDRVRETLRQMGRAPEERPTGRVAREVCQRLGLKAMVDGSVSRLGSTYALLVEARACETGNTLASAQGAATSKEEVLKTLGSVSATLRATLGESLKSVEQYNVPVTQATTPSLDALRAYALGLAERARGAETESIPFLERALTLDPNFAAAATTLSTVYGNLGEGRRAEEYARIAYANRDRVSERERLFITYQYHDRVTGDQDDAAETLEIWKATFPSDFRPSNALAIIDNRLGRFESGVEEAQEALRRSPKHPFPLSNLASAYRGLGQFDKAREVAKQAIDLGVASVPTRRLLYQVAVLRGDEQEAAAQLAWARGNPRESELVSAHAQVASYFGQVDEARELYRSAMQLAMERERPESADALGAHVAWMEALYGNRDHALAAARDSLRVREQGDANATASPRLRALVAMGLLGAPETTKLLDDVVTRYPRSTFVRGVLVPSVRGAIALQRGRADEAIDVLRAASQYEFGFSAALVPTYLRGLALLERHAPGEAAAEFQKVIDHRGTDPFSPVVALANLGMARAHRMSGDIVASTVAYRAFFELWKHADPDVPVLREAQREHASLPLPNVREPS